MFISFAASRSDGFKSWSDAHPSASNDDDYPTGATAVALAVPSFDDIEAEAARLSVGRARRERLALTNWSANSPTWP